MEKLPLVRRETNLYLIKKSSSNLMKDEFPLSNVSTNFPPIQMG